MLFPPSAFAAVLTSVAGLRQAVWSDAQTGAAFAVTCTVTAATRINNSYWVADDTGYAYVRTTNRIALAVGDRVAARGHVGPDRYRWQRAFLERAERLGAASVPSPVPAVPENLNDEAFDGRTVVMRGLVADIVHDAIDPDWRFLLMRSEAGPFFAAVCLGDGAPPPDALLGATVSAKGVANVLPDTGKRKFMTPQLTVTDLADITVLAPAPTDPDDAPPLPANPHGTENLRCKSVTLLSRMGCRSATGRVVAVFAHGRELLLRTPTGQILGADLKSYPPPCGTFVKVAGLPETDLFIIRLAKAVWKPLPDAPPPDDEPPVTLPETFDMDKALRNLCGRTVRLRGRIAALPGAGTAPDGVFGVVCGLHLVRIDASALPAGVPDGAAAPGGIVEVTGAFVRNTTVWTPRNLFPRTDGFTLVPRAAGDIRVLARPPWWTAGRLCAVIAALVAVLLSVTAWNGILRRLIETRGHQLYKKEIEKAEADLRVDERTRLAVELHDSLAQTLAGVAFQVDAAERTLRDDGGDAAAGFLRVARRTLLSCREDLRRCLWDLRSQTLEEPDFAAALRKAVAPHAAGAEVSVRFGIRRAQLSDTTAHNVLSIIRELCANAVRHGRARRIWIAGERTPGGGVRFSVRDDGAGFDPAARPGPAQGHFGLQGVKERAKRLGGTVTIRSAPGQGAKITVEIER